MTVSEHPEGWAAPVDGLNIEQASDAGEVVNLNVEGRQPVNPLKGFGQLWRKTYRVTLEHAPVTPEAVMWVWKERFADFQPPESHFYPPKDGIQPGSVFLINADTPGGAIYTGMMVLYTDDLSFTLITPEGHPESGWITFSAFEQDGATVVQIESLARAKDPVYELAVRLVGGRVQEQIWQHTLRALAACFGLRTPVTVRRQLVDRHVQWSQALNVRHNAQIRSLLYQFASPVRALRNRLDRTPNG
jgi:hypothetical protein